MEARQLGNTSLKTMPIGLGCMGMSEFYGQTDDSESLQTLRAAVDLGVNMFDTADIYGADGHNERLIGEALRPYRDQVLIATKFGFVRTDNGYGRAINGRPEHVLKACDESLKRLGVELIDLYYQHRVDANVPIEETVGAMAKLVEAGKVKALGLCEVSAATLRRAHSIHPISAVESELSLWSREAETNGVLKTCEELGITFVAFSPLGRGFFAGAVKQQTALPQDDFRHQFPRFQGESFEQNITLLDVLERMAKDMGCTTGQIALAWLLSRSPRVVAIPGTKRRKYLEQNVGAANVTLSSQDLAALEIAFPPGVAVGERHTEAGMKLVNM